MLEKFIQYTKDNVKNKREEVYGHWLFFFEEVIEYYQSNGAVNTTHKDFNSHSEMSNYHKLQNRIRQLKELQRYQPAEIKKAFNEAAKNVCNLFNAEGSSPNTEEELNFDTLENELSTIFAFGFADVIDAQITTFEELITNIFESKQKILNRNFLPISSSFQRHSDISVYPLSESQPPVIVDGDDNTNQDNLIQNNSTDQLSNDLNINRVISERDWFNIEIASLKQAADAHDFEFFILKLIRIVNLFEIALSDDAKIMHFIDGSEPLLDLDKINQAKNLIAEYKVWINEASLLLARKYEKEKNSEKTEEENLEKNSSDSNECSYKKYIVDKIKASVKGNYNLITAEIGEILTKDNPQNILETCSKFLNNHLGDPQYRNQIHAAVLVRDYLILYNNDPESKNDQAYQAFYPTLSKTLVNQINSEADKLFENYLRENLRTLLNFNNNGCELNILIGQKNLSYTNYLNKHKIASGDAFDYFNTHTYSQLLTALVTRNPKNPVTFSDLINIINDLTKCSELPYICNKAKNLKKEIYTYYTANGLPQNFGMRSLQTTLEKSGHLDKEDNTQSNNTNRKAVLTASQNALKEAFNTHIISAKKLITDYKTNRNNNFNRLKDFLQSRKPSLNIQGDSRDQRVKRADAVLSHFDRIDFNSEDLSKTLEKIYAFSYLCNKSLFAEFFIKDNSARNNTNLKLFNNNNNNSTLKTIAGFKLEKSGLKNTFISILKQFRSAVYSNIDYINVLLSQPDCPISKYDLYQELNLIIANNIGELIKNKYIDEISKPYRKIVTYIKNTQSDIENKRVGKINGFMNALALCRTEDEYLSFLHQVMLEIEKNKKPPALHPYDHIYRMQLEKMCALVINEHMSNKNPFQLDFNLRHLNYAKSIMTSIKILNNQENNFTSIVLDKLQGIIDHQHKLNSSTFKAVSDSGKQINLINVSAELTEQQKKSQALNGKIKKFEDELIFLMESNFLADAIATTGKFKFSDSDWRIITSGISTLMSQTNIPGSGALNSIANKIDEHRQINDANTSTDALKDSLGSIFCWGQLAKGITKILSKMFENEFAEMKEDDIKRLALFCFKRMHNSLKNGEIDQKLTELYKNSNEQTSIYQTFLMAVFSDDSKLTSLFWRNDHYEINGNNSYTFQGLTINAPIEYISTEEIHSENIKAIPDNRPPQSDNIIVEDISNNLPVQADSINMESTHHIITYLNSDTKYKKENNIPTNEIKYSRPLIFNMPINPVIRNGLFAQLGRDQESIKLEQPINNLENTV